MEKLFYFLKMVDRHHISYAGNSCFLWPVHSDFYSTFSLWSTAIEVPVDCSECKVVCSTMWSMTWSSNICLKYWNGNKSTDGGGRKGLPLLVVLYCTGCLLRQFNIGCLYLLCQRCLQRHFAVYVFQQHLLWYQHLLNLHNLLLQNILPYLSHCHWRVNNHCLLLQTLPIHIHHNYDFSWGHMVSFVLGSGSCSIKWCYWCSSHCRWYPKEIKKPDWSGVDLGVVRLN